MLITSIQNTPLLNRALRKINSPEHPELNKDDRVLSHGTKRTDQPWQICENVILLKRMKEDLVRQSVML